METSRAALIRGGNRRRHVGFPGVQLAYIKGQKPVKKVLITFMLPTPGFSDRLKHTHTQRKEE